MAVKDSNQVEFFMQNKRVPGNHNLTLWTEPQFRGYPINPNYSLVTQYLEKLHRVINGSIQGYPRTFAVLVELHCDRPTRELSDSNRVMQAFKDVLDARIASYLKQQVARGRRVYPAKVRWVWAREQSGSHVPHFHVLLLFNKDVFYALGDYSPGSSSLMSMIREAWNSALGIPPEHAHGLVHVPKNAEYHLVAANQYADLPHLFKRASYLCKAETKRFGQRVQCFGGSRE